MLGDLSWQMQLAINFKDTRVHVLREYQNVVLQAMSTQTTMSRGK